MEIELKIENFKDKLKQFKDKLKQIIGKLIDKKNLIGIFDQGEKNGNRKNES